MGKNFMFGVLFSMLMFLMSSVSFAGPANGVLRVSRDDVAIGGVYIGMDISEVQQIYGKATAEKPEYNGFFQYLGTQHKWSSHPGLNLDSFNPDFLVRTGKRGDEFYDYQAEVGNGSSTVFYVASYSNNGLETPRGIHVGSNEADVWSAYGFTSKGKTPDPRATSEYNGAYVQAAELSRVKDANYSQYFLIDDDNHCLKIVCEKGVVKKLLLELQKGGLEQYVDTGYEAPTSTETVVSGQIIKNPVSHYAGDVSLTDIDCKTMLSYLQQLKGKDGTFITKTYEENGLYYAETRHGAKVELHPSANGTVLMMAFFDRSETTKDSTNDLAWVYCTSWLIADRLTEKPEAHMKKFASQIWPVLPKKGKVLVESQSKAKTYRFGRIGNAAYILSANSK